MKPYIIAFALTLPEKKYKSFFLALDKLHAAKVLPNAFLVKTDRDIEEMRVALLPYLQKADGLVIAGVEGEVAIRNARCSEDMLQKLLSAAP